MSSEWKTIPEFSNYEISSCCAIRNKKTLREQKLVKNIL